MRIAILPIDKEGNNPQQNIYISTEIAYIITHLEQYNPDYLIFPWSDLYLLERTKPDVVCIYAPYSWTYEYVIEVCEYIKETLNIPIILMGEHISALPKTLPLSADVGILGDPESGLPQVIELINNKKFDDKNLAKIPAIVFNAKNRKIITSPPQYLSDLESWSMTRAVFYEVPGKWIPSIISGRGKPSNNAWQTLTNEPVRLFSVDKMIKDIADVLVNYNETKIIEIKDYLFLSDKKRFKDFVNMYKETQLKKYMHFEINSMIYQLDEEIINDLKNVLEIPKLTINFLSPIEKTYKEIRERFTPLKEQEKILDLCSKYSLNVQAKFMYNFPAENIEDTTKIYWDIKRNYLRRYNNLKVEIEPFIVLPGSEIWQKMYSKKIITESFNNWKSLDGYSDLTPSLSNIMNLEIGQLQNEFNKLSLERNDAFSIKLESENYLMDFERSPIVGMIRSFEGNLLKNMIPNQYDVDFDDQKLIKALSNQYLEETTEKLPENLILTLERILNSDEPTDIKEIRDKISEIREKYLINDEIEHHILYNTAYLTYLTLDGILEEIIKDANKKNILQVCDDAVLDLKKIFKKDLLDVDTLNPMFFNQPVLKNTFEKKYDMILLYFTPNIVVNFQDTLKFCRQITKENGVVLITFFNSKNIINLIRTYADLNLNDWIYGYKRTNHYTLSSINRIIKSEGFIAKNIESVDFPNPTELSVTRKVFYEFLNNLLTAEDLEEMFYVYSCRKF